MVSLGVALLVGACTQNMRGSSQTELKIDGLPVVVSWIRVAPDEFDILAFWPSEQDRPAARLLPGLARAAAERVVSDNCWLGKPRPSDEMIEYADHTFALRYRCVSDK